MKKTHLAWTVALSMSLACASAPVAHAQTGSREAENLFEQGRLLVAQGKYPEACPKFAESQRLQPNGGTLLNLAECLAKNGQTASAWRRFKEVAARAKAAGQAAPEKMALDRAAELEPQLSKLTIVIGSSATSEAAGLEIKRDGEVLATPERGVPVPVDPGPHLIEVSAPQRRPWSTTANVAPGAASVSVTIPELELLVQASVVAPSPATPTPTTPTTPTPEEPTSRPGSTQRTMGIVAGAVGIVGIGVGTVFGLKAKSTNDEALTHCRTASLCDPEGLSLTGDAKSAATLSTIFFIGGGVALAAGAVLYLTAPSGTTTTASRLHLAPTVGRGAGGFTLVGAW